MPRSTAKSSASAAAMGFAAPDPASAPEPALPVAVDAESQRALAKLDGAISELKALTIASLLRQAIDALRVEDPKTASEWALKALNHDPRSGMAWYVLAVAREKAGDFTHSIKAYESALALLPDQSEVANDLGRLAFRMGMKDVAEQLFRRYLESHPDAYSTMNNLATAVRDQGRAAEAIEILRAAVKGAPSDPMLWNTLGTVVSEQGDHATAIVFFEEALRLDPDFAQARYNRGNAHLELGDTETALADCEAAIGLARAAEDLAMMRLARSTIKVVLGRIGEGWDDYEARLDPQFAGATVFLVERPLWTPTAPMPGKTLLVMGEQGLGDEVLFAGMLPDVAEALGPDGKLVLAVEERLAPLFQRSFPAAEVVPHVTFRQHGRNFRAAPAAGDFERFDLWVPMASLLQALPPPPGGLPRPHRLPDPRPGAPRPLARGAGRRAGGPQGRHPLEEHEGRVRQVALLFAVRALGAGAEDARRHLRQRPVRRLRRRDRMGQARARRRDLDAAGDRPAAGPRRHRRAHLGARSDAGLRQRDLQHRRGRRRADLDHLRAGRLDAARHRPHALVSAGAGVLAGQARQLGSDHGDGRRGARRLLILPEPARPPLVSLVQGRCAMPDPNPDPDGVEPDAQDQAEVFDEENITADGRDIATSDLQRDVYDVTSADEDARESLEPEDDFDPDAADEAELEELVLSDEDLDEPRSFTRDDADLVAADDARPADFEAASLADDAIEELGDGSGDSAGAEGEDALEAQLDEGLRETFPASDPVAVTRRSD